MFRKSATIDRSSSPVLSDWTTQELLEWIGADDARCHDGTLLGPLTAIDGALAAQEGGDSSALAPASPAPLVRALAARLRAEPALRDVRLGDLVDIRSQSPAPRGDREPGAERRTAASVRLPQLRVS
ncbi:hypothetical protein [Microbacterium trichothecenolyticum]|uniref:Uncharacterized protein n=1 Tax=Microbacterium trichothecenolyticum TaxID=69370 RepID=A0A0M2HEW6_MICTR|nr:hypothetical protein [Microbacterium trichothecenolyticum]KJL42797.1 hypothetical protein RS82_01761 [Microbacterium trichothecenolyticum]